MCKTCTDFVLTGETKAIGKRSELLKLAARIDNEILELGWYWTEMHDEFFDDFKTKCHTCGSYHERMNYVYSMRDDEFLGIE